MLLPFSPFSPTPGGPGSPLGPVGPSRPLCPDGPSCPGSPNLQHTYRASALTMTDFHVKVQERLSYHILLP